MNLLSWLSQKTDPAELVALAAKVATALVEVSECVRRLRSAEREIEDLHAAYRRLRAGRAGEAKRGEVTPPEEPVVLQDRKTMLRAKARTLVSVHRGQHGPTE